MRKISLTGLLLLTITAVTNAQYKKVNFLNKRGRIYDFGTTLRLQTGERSSSFGVLWSYGKENDDKRVHHWYDVEIVFGNKFSYTSSAGLGQTATVSGKTPGVDIGLRYNFGYFLTDNSQEDNKLLPFLVLSLGYIGRSLPSNDFYTVNPSNLYPEKTPGSGTAYFSAGAGIGIVYRITPGIGIRLSGSYYYIFGGEKSAYTFPFIESHPAISLALRFRMRGGDD